MFAGRVVSRGQGNPWKLTAYHASSIRALATAATALQASFQELSGSDPDEPLYWQKIGRWADITKSQFKTYRWQTKETIGSQPTLYKFLEEVVPENLVASNDPLLQRINTKQDFIEDAMRGLEMAPMAVRLTPHILSVINWQRALDDPIRRQFIPLRSGFIQDHPQVTLDSLSEKDDSPVEGLVHRYPTKALFLVTSVCPVYCRFCTRSYAVGPHSVVTKEPQKPSRRRWAKAYEYLARTPAIEDVVVSGGDSYYLMPDQVKEVGEMLLSIPHIRRIRFASKGLAVVPSRTLDPDDSWTRAFIELSDFGREMGKQVCLHTHFNHPNEITWITREAARHLFRHGVIVRNQSVLLRGVNDDVDTMGTLLSNLAAMNIEPYYVYQCDLVRGIEDLRTPLSTILEIEKRLRGSITGFMMPNFVVDLPGGGGKRIASTYESYNPASGISTFTAPALYPQPGKKDRVYEYHDPLPEGVPVYRPRAGEENTDEAHDAPEAQTHDHEPVYENFGATAHSCGQSEARVAAFAAR